MSVRITSSSVNSNKFNRSANMSDIIPENMANMIARKHQSIAHGKVKSKNVSWNRNKDVSGKANTASFPSRTSRASLEEIQDLKKQLAIGSQNYQNLIHNYHYICQQFEILKNANQQFTTQSEKFKSQIEELTAKNQILEQKASGNQDDFIDTKQELSDSREKYQELQARMYKILGAVPALSFFNPNDTNSEVKVPGKVIGFTYNQHNGNVTGARVVVDCKISDMRFAFNQFWLNYDKNIDIKDWDKVVIFCPGGLSNVNHLEENSTVMVKLITNPKPKANKTPNTIGIIVSE